MQRLSELCRRLSLQVWANLTPHYFSANCCHGAAATNTAFQRWKHTIANGKEETGEENPKFSGYIPVVNTKVEVRFHVQSATWMQEEVKEKLLNMERNRITKDGYFVLTSDRTRKQLLNQADVMDKLRSMVFRAAVTPRGLTEEEISLRDKRLAKSKERTLREKRHNSLKKQSRGSQF